MSNNNIKKTIKTKKQKVVGKQNYINQNTGEIVETVVIEKNVESDFNFHKIWLIDMMSILGEMGNKKIKIIEYIINQTNKDNIVYFTYKQIEKDIGVSHPLVVDSVKNLIEKNFMKRIQTGVYQVNPDLIVKGNSSKRMNLLIKYNKIDNKDTKDTKERK